LGVHPTQLISTPVETAANRSKRVITGH
ncbi:MAG: hypothetical protein QOE53_1141, partial [Pseudonocardiales bacterium]|nr:hypothetical protein [Pseudonocardiales bacterium]